MSAVALLKFYQATPTPITGDGEALKVVAANVVQITNSDDTDVKAWSLELLYAPPGSTHGPVNPNSPVLLDTGTDADPLDYDFTPDVAGSYRFRLTVEDESEIEDIDLRCIAVPLTNGFIIPPYERDPLPLESTDKPNELNFDGQPWGWAGDDEDTDHLLGNAIVRRVDDVGTLESELNAHLADTNNPHQTDIENLGNGTLAELNDAITDATLDDENDPRTPTAHASSHEDGGSDEITHQNLDGAGTYTHTEIDSHINNTNNPHQTDIENLGSGTLAELNDAITDATLDDSSDPRTPTAHASTHITGGSDVIPNANASSAGLLPAVSSVAGAIGYSTGSVLGFADNIRVVLTPSLALEIGAPASVATEGGARFTSDNASVVARNVAGTGNVNLIEKDASTDKVNVGEGSDDVISTGDDWFDMVEALTHPNAPTEDRLKLYSMDDGKEFWGVDQDGDRTQLM